MRPTGCCVPWSTTPAELVAIPSRPTVVLKEPRAWEAPSDHSEWPHPLVRSMGNDRGCPRMTAADRCLDGVSLLGAGMAGSRAMTVLVDDLVPDQLWAIVEPLLPAPPRPPPYGGRHRTISDRNSFAAIVFMARTSTRGGYCPPESSAAVRRRPAGAA